MIDFRELFGHSSIAVSGLAKNTGKTVTVNFLLAKAQELGITVGLTSTGRDGETMDVVSALPKPPIHLPQGAVLATARGSLSKGSARLEILETTDVTNPLGEIVIAKVRQQGTVEISGPERRNDLSHISSRLQALCKTVIIDGALDRRAASAPSVAQASILATGAVLGPSVQAVVTRTVHAAKVLMLPVLDCPVDIRRVVENGEVAVAGEGGLEVLPLRTAVDAPLDILDYLTPKRSRLILGGAFTSELAELLLTVSHRLPKLEVVVADGTRVFVESSRWNRLLRKVGVFALDPINLVAITVNPIDPRGRQLPGSQLVDSIQKLLPEVSVFNPLAEGGV